MGTLGFVTWADWAVPGLRKVFAGKSMQGVGGFLRTEKGKTCLRISINSVGQRLKINNCFHVEKLGPGKNTKVKSKGEALGQSISLNLVYTHTPPPPPHTHHTNFYDTSEAPRRLVFGIHP